MFCSVLTNRRLRAIKNCILKLILGSQHPVVYSFFCANKGIAQRAELHSGLLYRRSAVLCYCAVFFRQPAEETMVVWQPNYSLITLFFCASVLVSGGAYLYCKLVGLTRSRDEARIPRIRDEVVAVQQPSRSLFRPGVVSDVQISIVAPAPEPRLTFHDKVYNWFWVEGHGWPVPNNPAGVEIVVMILLTVILILGVWGRPLPDIFTEKVVPKPPKVEQPVEERERAWNDPEGEGLYQGRRPEEYEDWEMMSDERGLVFGIFVVWLICKL